MQKITPNLWFDRQAQEAAALYTSVFKNSKQIYSYTLHNTPSGDADIILLSLAGQDFLLLNGGPYFTPNASVSFLVSCETPEEVDATFAKLGADGMVYMELGSYPFSQRYGWTTDKFGFSWQIMLSDGSPISQKITPTLMFAGSVCGKAEEAVNFYTSQFPESGIDHIMKYEEVDAPDTPGTVRHAGFSLVGQQFAAMDSARVPDATFNEAVSLIISCENQDEVDSYWEKLSADPKAEQCGWLKDKFGLPWQVTPKIMDEMLLNGTPEQVERVTQAFLPMKKIDIATIQQAFDGK